MGYERKVRLYHTAKPGRAGREAPPLRGQILGGISISNSPISLQYTKSQSLRPTIITERHGSRPSIHRCTAVRTARGESEPLPNHGTHKNSTRETVHPARARRVVSGHKPLPRAPPRSRRSSPFVIDAAAVADIGPQRAQRPTTAATPSCHKPPPGRPSGCSRMRFMLGL